MNNLQTESTFAPRTASASPTAELLPRYKEVQRLAYACAQAVAADLQPGVTEREAAASMRRWLEARGVDDWFHLPFAWFGDRTAFEGLRTPLGFLPTSRRLQEGMPFILDVGPIVGGVPADIGYAGCLGENRLHARMLTDLAEYRDLVLAGVRAGHTLRHVYEDVDRLIARHGFSNRHAKYPFGVIAHRVAAVSGPGAARMVGPFGVRSLGFLARTIWNGRRGGWGPFWNGGRGSDHPATPGIWAVEPHIGFRGVGVKFEELLVVTDETAYWLDDDLPHVRRWRAS